LKTKQAVKMRNNVCHNAGTTVDTFLRENLVWFVLYSVLAINCLAFSILIETIATHGHLTILFMIGIFLKY
jgi:hypothetical protein